MPIGLCGGKREGECSIAWLGRPPLRFCVAHAIAPASPQVLRAFRLAPRPTPSPRPNTRPTATPKEPNALHHSGQRQRLGDSSATRHKDDEGEDFRGPLWQCTTLVACASGRVVVPIDLDQEPAAV